MEFLPVATRLPATSWRSAASFTSNIAAWAASRRCAPVRAARYGHEKNPAQKVAAEGIEALKEACGSVDRVLAQLIGGIQSGMGYLGAENLAQLRAKARYIRVSSAGMKEAAPHDVVELKTGN